jgi:hypothetical protein
MKSISLSRIFLIFGLFFLIGISAANINLVYGETPYIQVTLKDNTVEKFTHDSFDLNWAVLQIKAEFTCNPFDIDVEDVTEIYVLTIEENTCIESEYREDWLFDVHFTNRRAIQGFIELYEPSVSGKLLDKDEIKSIPYKDIQKISFLK